MLYDGTFYRFTDEQGRQHTMAGERDFNLIKATVTLVVPLINKYGFTMAFNNEIHKDSWQVFDLPEQRDNAAREYAEKVCKPLNEAHDIREANKPRDA